MKQIEKISFWRWCGVTIGGFFAGTFVSILLDKLVKQILPEGLEFFPVIYCTIVGYLQFRLLRRVRSVSKQWIWTAALGYMIPLLLTYSFGLVIDWGKRYHDIVLSVNILIGSVIVGILHSYILRKNGYKNTVVYIISYVASWLSSTILIKLIYYINIAFDLPDIYMNLPAFTSVACSFGFFTALGIRYIQEQTIEQSEVHGINGDER